MSKLDLVDVLVAFQNGKEVEYSLCGNKWDDALNMPVGVFLNPDKMRDYKFRLKPQTIKLNNIEVPAPFEPKEGDKVWVISDYRNGYHEVVYNGKVYNALGRWRTEEEIKQVVEALKIVFKPQ